MIIPATISYLVIFHFPKITDLFLVRQKKNKDEEDKILRENFKSEEQNIKAETELIKAERDKFEAEKDKIKVQLEVEMKEKAFAWAQEEIKKAKAEG